MRYPRGAMAKRTTRRMAGEAVVDADATGDAGRVAGDGALLVRPKAGTAMSRLQRTFNGLVQQLSVLEQRLATQRDDLEALLERYQQRVAKSDRAVAEAQVALAAALAAAHGRLRLRGNQKQDLAAMICDLCEDAFLVLRPDAPTEALYDEWSDRSYRDVFERAVPAGGEDFHDDDDDGEQAEGERDAGAAAGDDDGPQRHGGTPRDDADAEHGSRYREHRRADFAARQARRLEQEALTRRSVREVYLSLARVLHPDTVTDPSERLQREEAMKQATGAYREGDLLALLRLELRWIRRESDRGDGPGDDTLRAYVRALRQQVEKLEDALAAQAADPRYDAIAGVAFLPRSRALAELDVRARELRAATAELVELRAIVHGCESRQELAAIVRGARHHRAR
jgi:hypothetical protein